jgi:DNA polymerase-1
LIFLYNYLIDSNINAKMIMQVHDELVFEVAEADVEVLQSHIHTLMASAAELDVPLIVDIGVGDNWDEAH